MKLKKRRLVRKRRTAPGTAPGVLVADPTALPTSITTVAYGPEMLEEQHQVNASVVKRLHESAPVLWVDVVGLADQEAIRTLAATFGLHPLAIEDVTDTDHRPKIEVFDDHLFLVLRMITPGGGIEGEQVAMMVGPGYVLTFQERPGDVFAPVRQRLRHARGRFRQSGADYLAYALLDAVIDGYFPALEALGEQLERLEDEAVTAPTPRLAAQLHATKRDLLTLRRAVWPSRELMNALLRDEVPLVTPAIRPFLRDVYDHTVQLMDMVETYREIASGLLDVYLSSQGTRLNEVMKVLTIIATIFIPLSFVASLYGMNFDTSSPWNMPELGWRYGYPFVLGLMAAMAGGLLWYFARKGWLRENGR